MARARGVVILEWRKKKPPSPAQLRALGRLPPGAYRVNPGPRNPSDAEKEYERFHWGTKAKRKIRVKVSVPRELYEIGKLKRVEYETVKQGERATWYHDFTRPFPSLTATPSGKLGPIVGGRAKVEPRGIVG